MKATLHYILRTDRPRPDGSALIYLRLTINRRNKPIFSMYRNIPLKAKYKHLSIEQIEAYPVKREPGDTTTITRDELYCWDKAKGRATRGFGSAETLNQFLNEEIVRAENIINDLGKRKKALTAASFRWIFKKTNADMPFYEYCHEQLVKQDSTLAEETIKGYLYVMRKREKYKPGLRMEEIDFKFLTAYYNYLLKTESEGGLGNEESTANKNMKTIRTMIRLAIKNGDLMEEHYPFKDFKIGDTVLELTSRDFLEPEEILQLEKLVVNYYPPSHTDYKRITTGERKKRVADNQLSLAEYETLNAFLFACYTGLRYRDIFLLNIQEHIKAKWVQNPYTFDRKFRHYIDVEEMHKTGRSLIVPLIDKAINLIDLKKQGSAFKPKTNQKTNLNLKRIAKRAKINKTLSFHVARHTFATTCFTYGIPAEVGQKLLGHKSEKFIKVYTHLTQNRLFHEMDKVSQGFNDHEELLRVIHNQDQKVKEPADELAKRLEDRKFRELVEGLSKMNKDKLNVISNLVRWEKRA